MQHRLLELSDLLAACKTGHAAEDVLVLSHVFVSYVVRSAATEIGVLQDVLAVARDKRYLLLDPVNNEMLEQRNLPILLMLARKKVYLLL